MSDRIPGGMMSPPPPPGEPVPGGTSPRYPYRVKRGRKWAGVANGIAMYLGLSPGWVRLAFVVATFVGGLGLALYLAAWLALPEEGDPDAGVSPFRTGPDRNRALLGIGLLLIVTIAIIGEGDFDGFAPPLALVVAGGALWLWRVESLKARSRRAGEWGPPTAAPPPPAGAGPNAWAPPPAWSRAPSTPPAGQSPPYRPPATSPTPPPVVQPARVVAPPAPRSPLGVLTFATSLLVLAAAVLVDRLGWARVTPSTALTWALAVTAAGLIAGVWFGRARGVLGWGVVLALGVVATSAVGELDLPFTAGIGEKRRAATTLAELEPKYELTIGELEVDLSDLDLAGTTQEVEVNLGLGQVRVVVPDDVNVAVKASAGLGTVQVFDHEEGGVGTDYRTVQRVGEGAGTLILDVSTATGEVIVDTPDSVRLDRPKAPPTAPTAPTAPTTPATEGGS